MALYEFECRDCRNHFEQISSRSDPEQGKCPKCKSLNTKKLISKFAFLGQGDQRESTQHGCHDCEVPLAGESHGHDHGDEH